MTATDIAVLGGCGLLGWAVVSWLVKVVRQQKAPPVEFNRETATLSSAPTSAAPSLAELGARWHTILGVPADASASDIQSAYHRGLAECDRVRFSNSEADADRLTAEQRRVQLTEAYEFIRRVRQ